MPNEDENDPRESRAEAAEATRGDRLLGLAPDSLPLTENRARYLANLAGIDAKEIAGRSIAEVHEALRWRLDPQLFAFRRICGQVVRRDPVTGELQPVPNATVHVEDTDCSYLSYFPRVSSYAWLFPFGCRREEIATVTTDACGRFCVFLPFWDVDRILRWRRQWTCDWVFQRPRLRDLVEISPERIGPPGPDPGPLTRLQPGVLDRLRDTAGDAIARRSESARGAILRGERQAPLQETLDEPLFRGFLPPPLPSGEDEKSLGEILGGRRRGLPDRLDFRQLRGPFLRCRQELVPVWQLVLDVPDVTLRVTQDVDADGTEETIYSEGFFDVRWNTGSIPDVTLEASANAVATPFCGPEKVVPCGNVPSIEAAGYLDLEPGYHDDATGYGLRVNRPTTGDDPPPPDPGSPGPQEANAPYAGNLNLHGCVRLAGATHYRIKSEHSPEPPAPFGPQTPLLGISWMAPRLGAGPPIPFLPDADGWYPIVDPAILVHESWLLPWNTGAQPNGLYRLVLETGQLSGGAITPLEESAPRLFLVDNDRPTLVFEEVRWRPSSVSGPWNQLNSTRVLPTADPETCPVIERPAGQSIDLRVTWSAAATHLRNAALGQSGCSSAGGFELLDGGPPAYRHWHTGPADNNVTQANHFRLPGTHPPGCYSLSLYAASRAFNPQDFDAASTQDWWVNQAFRDSHASRAISVVNA